MKNINYYKTPFDKMKAHDDWCKRNREKCPYYNNSLYTPICYRVDHALCFNAWLHSNREGGAK